MNAIRQRLREDPFELHHPLVLVGEAEAVGEIVPHHAAVFVDAVSPFLAVVVGGVVLGAGHGFVGGERDFREVLEKLAGNLAVALEKS